MQRNPLVVAINQAILRPRVAVSGNRLMMESALKLTVNRLLVGFLICCAGAAAQQYASAIYAGGAPPSLPTVFFNNMTNGHGLAVDAAGSVYFSGNGCVFKKEPNGSITRIAGTSYPGYSGDGGPAVSAQLSIPQGLGVDGAGNLFIADSGNLRLRRVTPDGIITTVAGSGAGGAGVAGAAIGDGGPAVQARINPGDLAVDWAGNLYVTDVGRIRKVAPSGIITTVAGTGVPGFSGDGGPATGAQLGRALGVAVDGAGSLFIADGSNARVRKVTPSGIITTVAGGGTQGDGAAATDARLLSAVGVAMDGAGNLFIADINDNRIRKVSESGIISTVAGNGVAGYSGDGGPAVSAMLYWPSDLAVDSTGSLLILDVVNARIRRVTPDGTIATLVAADQTNPAGDGGPATSAYLGYPMGVAVDSAGNVFIADTGVNRVRKVSTSGVIATVAGNGLGGSSGDGGPATSAALGSPLGVAVDAAGNLFIASDERIRKVSSDGIIATVAGNGTAGFSGDGRPATAAQLRNPVGVAVDSAGNLFIADKDNLGVRKVATDGTITTVAGNGGFGWFGDGGPATAAGFTQVSGVAVDSAGNLFIASGPLRKVSPDGIISSPGSTTISNAVVANAVAIDKAGNLFLTFDNSVRLVSPGGSVTTIANLPRPGGPSSVDLPSPAGVAVDSSGNIFVADVSSNVIRVLRPATAPPPAVSIAAVVDAASERPDPVSPGKIVVIYGTGLGPAQLIQNQPMNGRYGTNLGGTSVSFNGIPASLLYASATQVAAIVPYAITGSMAQTTVTYQGQTSPAFPVAVAAAAPSLFTANQTGAGQAAARNSDQSVNTADNPVPISGYISLYATGEGQTMPAGQDGSIAGPALSHPILPVTASVGGISANAQYAGGAPGLVAGLLQVNVQIPAGVQPGGYVPVVLQIGNSVSGPGVWIAVSGN